MNQLNKLPDMLFSGLNKDYCFVFNIFTMLSLTYFVILAINVAYYTFSVKGKNFRLVDFVMLVGILGLAFINYLRDRVFYYMCLH